MAEQRNIEFAPSTKQFARTAAGEKCCMCRKQLAGGVKNAKTALRIGHVAHIRSRGEPRFGPVLSRDLDHLRSPDNAMLLCELHHQVIDDKDCPYGADQLKDIRNHHYRTVMDGEVAQRVFYQEIVSEPKRTNRQILGARLVQNLPLVAVVALTLLFAISDGMSWNSFLMAMLGTLLVGLTMFGCAAEYLRRGGIGAPHCYWNFEEGFNEFGHWVFTENKRLKLVSKIGPCPELECGGTVYACRAKQELRELHDQIGVCDRNRMHQFTVEGRIGRPYDPPKIILMNTNESTTA